MEIVKTPIYEELSSHKNDILARFFRYVKIDTTSQENQTQQPSTECQWDLSRLLLQEALGFPNCKDQKLSEHSYLTFNIPSNTDRTTYSIGFVAHLDTSNKANGTNVHPIIDIEDGNETIKPKGDTLLGADDKAGITAIMSMVEYLHAHPEIEHGNIYIAFTPDEEVGRGTENFPYEEFTPSFAYTVDGGELGEFSYETFNALNIKITFFGINTHTGYAKDKMINSIKLANEFISNLPIHTVPERTDGRQGFYHIAKITGDVSKTEVHINIRDFDSTDNFLDMIQLLLNNMKKRYNNENLCTIDTLYEAHNIKNHFRGKRHVIDRALDAMKEAKIEPNIVAVRGGTDGADLSAHGIPCPNIFTGGYNFHSTDEALPVNSLLKCIETLINIAKI